MRPRGTTHRVVWVPPEMRARLLEMVRTGKTQKDLAGDLGTSVNNIQNLIAPNGMVTPRVCERVRERLGL